MKRYAISDIHGCVKTFKALLKQIHFSKADELYLLGDYIDRGPNSKAVIDHIWELQLTGHQIFCLKGNHEQMMINALSSQSHQHRWLIHGGRTTLQSFGNGGLNQVPKEYIRWLQELPHYREIDGYILVHAGLDFNIKNPMEDQTAMLWIRKWYETINKDWLGDRIIVHGHTPIKQTVIESMVKNLSDIPVANIDGGCVFVEPEYQILCALDLDDQVLYFQKRAE